MEVNWNKKAHVRKAVYEVVKMSFKQGVGRGGSVAGEELRSAGCGLGVPMR